MLPFPIKPRKAFFTGEQFRAFADFQHAFRPAGRREPDVCRGGACRYGLQYDRRVPQGIVAVDRRFFPVQMEFGDYLYF